MPSEQILLSALPALIALAGTLSVALLSYRQWKRQQDTASQQQFLAERRTAYKQLWDLLADTKYKILSAPPRNDQGLEKIIDKTIAFIRKNSVYIDQQDGVLAIQYLEDFYEFRRLIPNLSHVPRQHTTGKKPFRQIARLKVRLAIALARMIEWLSRQPLSLSLIPSVIWSLLDTIYFALAPYISRLENYSKLFIAWDTFDKTRGKLISRLGKIVRGVS